MKPHEMHRTQGKVPLSFHLITVSSSRFAKLKAGSEYTDESGDLAERKILADSHKVGRRKLISDRPEMILSALKEFLKSKSDVLLFMGGTGVAPTDITVETVAPILEKELTGFGEILRSVSFQRIGSAAVITRATAGTVKGKLIVCLPGSPDAVDTALRTFMAEFPHIVTVAGGSRHKNSGHSA